jgi:formylglycine-generating enzyme required for sulfatase activity
MRNHYNWWDWVPGADWRHPEGPGSTLDGRDRHPVVHAAWEDVEAFAAWAEKEIPSEAEWELAARGGLDGAEYAWGDEFAPKGRQMANTWQGEFPFQNLKHDGFERTAPVGSFPPNGFGLFDMIGNAWEWTTDWYRDGHQVANGCCGSAGINPTGGDREGSIDVRDTGDPIPRKVIKGGSHLCAPNYCRRYRPAARMHHPIDTGTSHIGFRCIVRKVPAAV